MTQPTEGVTAEGALQDLSILRAIEKRSPLLQLAHALGSWLGMDVRHEPVVKHLSTAHGVAKMSAPIVRRVHVGHRRSDAAFCHDGMRLTQERFANYAHSRALCQGAEGRSQAGSAGADDQH